MKGLVDQFINHRHGRFSSRASLCRVCFCFFQREKRAQGKFCPECISKACKTYKWSPNHIADMQTYKWSPRYIVEKLEGEVMRSLQEQILCHFCSSEQKLIVSPTGNFEALTQCDDDICNAKRLRLMAKSPEAACSHAKNALLCEYRSCRRDVKLSPGPGECWTNPIDANCVPQRCTVPICTAPIDANCFPQLTPVRDALAELVKNPPSNPQLLLAALGWYKENGLTPLESIAQRLAFSPPNLYRFNTILGIEGYNDPVGAAQRRLIDEWPAMTDSMREVFYGALVRSCGQVLSNDKLELILREDEIDAELLNAMLDAIKK